MSCNDSDNWRILTYFLFNSCWKYAKYTNWPRTWSWRIFGDDMVGRIWLNNDDLELGIITVLNKQNELLGFISLFIYWKIRINESHHYIFFCVNLCVTILLFLCYVLRYYPFCITFFNSSFLEKIAFVVLLFKWKFCGFGFIHFPNRYYHQLNLFLKQLLHNYHNFLLEGFVFFVCIYFKVLFTFLLSKFISNT